MASFGEQLRREREVRGLSIETICDTTKVSAKHIRALEADAFGELPGGVFRRGFVRSYLSVLDLEEAAWMKRFEQTCRENGVADPADTEWATFAENVKNSRLVTRRSMGWRWIGVAAMALFLFAASWCCWRYVTHQTLLPHTPPWRHTAPGSDANKPVGDADPQPRPWLYDPQLARREGQNQRSPAS